MLNWSLGGISQIISHIPLPSLWHRLQPSVLYLPSFILFYLNTTIPIILYMPSSCHILLQLS